MSKKNKAGSMILGVAFVWFTTHFGGGFASGAQIYSYYVRYGIWSLFMPLFAMAHKMMEMKGRQEANFTSNAPTMLSSGMIPKNSRA